MRRFRIYIMLLLAALALPHAARAEENIDVEINKGKMVKLSAPASSVIVSDPTTADVQVISPTLLFVHGKKVGDTSIYAIDKADTQIYSATVSVTHNISKLQKSLKRAMPDSNVRVRTMDGGIMLDGFADSAEEAEHIRAIAAAYIGDKEKLVNMIRSSSSDQVALKVKIVEMARNDLKKFGVNLQNITSNGLFALQLLRGNDILFHTADPDVQAFNSWDAPLYRGGSSDGKFMMRYKDTAAVVDAMENNGLATVLAEPVLTTTSGTTANFLAGGEFPLPTLGQNNTVTIEYKKFGVSLDFTPTVLSKGRISISVTPEVSSLNFSNPIQLQGYSYPLLETRKAKSTVELGSGDTFMLAGLLKSETGNSVDKFPGLGDVPILGSLFRSNQFRNNQTELVILVTPYLVRPMSEPKKVQTPVDGLTHPTDAQRMLLGSLYGQQEMTEEEKQNIPKLHGKGGFIYE